MNHQFDIKDFSILIKKHVNLIFKKYKKRGLTLDKDDLTSKAILYFYECEERFNQRKGKFFEHYLNKTLKNGLYQFTSDYIMKHNFSREHHNNGTSNIEFFQNEILIDDDIFDKINSNIDIEKLKLKLNDDAQKIFTYILEGGDISKKNFSKNIRNEFNISSCKLKSVLQDISKAYSSLYED